MTLALYFLLILRETAVLLGEYSPPISKGDEASRDWSFFIGECQEGRFLRDDLCLPSVKGTKRTA
jgi:hypothetical protein